MTEHRHSSSKVETCRGMMDRVRQSSSKACRTIEDSIATSKIMRVPGVHIQFVTMVITCMGTRTIIISIRHTRCNIPVAMEFFLVECMDILVVAMTTCRHIHKFILA